MRCFIIGILSAAITFIFLGVVYGIYRDFTYRPITGELFTSVMPIQADIEHKLINGDDAVSIDLTKYNLTSEVKKILISEFGEITVQGGKLGQIFILTPRLNENVVEWNCMGGPYWLMPAFCRDT